MNFALLTSAACVAKEVAPDSPIRASSTSAGDDGPMAEEQGAANSVSVLGWSKPAAESISNAPVNELLLHFTTPVRLLEVTVTGPDGTMPMMVSAAGEVEHYSLPLSDLGPGRYAVAWRGSAGADQHNGSFRFEVK
jgi:methionine-rich copper-binding protein CopC